MEITKNVILIILRHLNAGKPAQYVLYLLLFLAIIIAAPVGDGGLYNEPSLVLSDFSEASCMARLWKDGLQTL